MSRVAKSVAPVVRMLRDRSFDNPVMEPGELRNLAAALEYMAEEIDLAKSKAGFGFALALLLTGFICYALVSGFAFL